jgi:hypothetical protein
MAERLVASTQYQDAEGTVAIDWPGGTEIHDFVQDCGIDTDRFFPVAIEVYNSEGFESVSIYAVDCQIAGRTADDIIKYGRSHGGTLPVKKFRTEASLADIIKRTKRFSLVAINRIGKGFNFEVQPENEPLFGTHVKEALRVIKGVDKR